MIPLKDNIPSRFFPFVTIGLIIANVLIFLYQLVQGMNFEVFLIKYAAIPQEVTSGQELTPNSPFPVTLTIFSSMFMHGGFFHLFSNMLYLWIFGDNVEDRLGHFKFLIFYLLCGVAATFSHILTNPHSTLPMVGASGAIAGVLGAYIITFPNARILTLIFFGFFVRIIQIPAVFVLGFWFILQLLNGLPSLGSAGITGGVAWFAHIGGFIWGIILLNIFKLFHSR
jgi:membrane associated rhomboid family serine protease